MRSTSLSVAVALALLALQGALASLTPAVARSASAEAWVARYNGPGGDLDATDAVAASPDGQSPGATTGDDFATIAY
jgi:hypothetical protein